MILFLIIQAIFVIVLKHEFSSSNKNSPKLFNFGIENSKRSSRSDIEELGQLFKKYKTSKYGHLYHNLYGFYFGHIKNEQLNILEIGIGCGMSFGVGKSLMSWKEYFQNSKISIFEYNQNCAEKFRDKMDNLYIGDQSNFDDLRKVEKNGPYDLIVDDGGHSRRQMINSLVGLFPYLKSGGVYAVEDLFFANSNQRRYKDLDKSMLNLINDLINYLSVQDRGITISFEQYGQELQEGLKYLTKNLLSINCFRRSCAFIKKSV